MASDSRKVLIVGGGTAGITVAARLRRSGLKDITLLDPATTHYYQPLWTLVGGGQADVRTTAKPQSKLIPRGVRRLRDAAAEFDYDLNPAPSIPFIDTTKERRDMWLLKRYGLPALHWRGMLRGVA